MSMGKINVKPKEELSNLWGHTWQRQGLEESCRIYFSDIRKNRIYSPKVGCIWRGWRLRVPCAKMVFSCQSNSFLSGSALDMAFLPSVISSLSLQTDLFELLTAFLPSCHFSKIWLYFHNNLSLTVSCLIPLPDFHFFIMCFCHL